ncbi:hypothetical protein GCM10022293_20490 [Azospirillum formosense]
MLAAFIAPIASPAGSSAQPDTIAAPETATSAAIHALAALQTRCIMSASPRRALAEPLIR